MRLRKDNRTAIAPELLPFIVGQLLDERRAARTLLDRQDVEIAMTRAPHLRFGGALTRTVFLARRLRGSWGGQEMVGILLPPSVAGDLVNPQNAQVLAWNQYRIEMQGDVITVSLNGVNTAKYTNTDPNRGRFSAVEPTFVGLQSYSNYSFTTAFRNIRVTVL